MLDDGDLEDMYAAYSGRKEIMLWVYAPASLSQTGRKRSGSPLPPEKELKSHKSDAHTKKLVEVEEIADDLEHRHGGAYT